MPSKLERFRAALEHAEYLQEGNYPLQPRAPMENLIETAREFLDNYESRNH